MKGKKATKEGDIAIEVYKALARKDGAAFDWFLGFMNTCWEDKVAPREWSVAAVAMNFKKGDPAACNNYRPICVLSIAFKLLASMTKQRLLDAGIENHLLPSQF